MTDVLVLRHSQEVVTSFAGNGGANFSHSGFLHMVRRSEGGSILAQSVGLRTDIPRHLFQQLIAKASEEVRHKVERERPDMELQIHRTIVDVTGAIHARFGPASKDYFAAKRTVANLHQRGELTEDKVRVRALPQVQRNSVALSLLCKLPIDMVERALIGKDREPVLILAKSLDWSWPTTMPLLFLEAPHYRVTAGDLDRLKLDFHRLNVKTSRSVNTLYRSQRTMLAAHPFQRSHTTLL